MPLEQGFSRKIISHNIDELTHHGSRPRSHDQIVAIALSEADKSKRRHLAEGGFSLNSYPSFAEREEAFQLRNSGDFHGGGLFASDVAGRTDRLPHSVAADSFVMPADVVAGLGQSNTLAGAKILDSVIGSATGPYGTHLERTSFGHRASGGNASDGEGATSKVMVAGGEYLVPRHALQNIGWRRNGGGKPNPRRDLAEGHKWARWFVEQRRKHDLKFLKNAPKPKA